MNGVVVGPADIPRVLEGHSAPIIWLRGVRYPSFLLLTLREWLQQKAVKIISLPLHDHLFETIQQSAASSFLGETYWYWLGDCADLPKKKQDQLRAYALSYAGPHTLVFYAPTHFVRDIPSHWCVLDIPESVSLKECERICTAWYNARDVSSMVPLLKALYFTHQSMPFEQIALIRMYASLVGKSMHEFVAVYQRSLVAIVPGLFLLSQHFFNKQADLFYAEWERCAHLYSLPFWIVFWSEHVWRASAYIRYMHKKDRTGAYEIGKNRLPYDFIKGGWSKIDPVALDALHNQLYALDVSIKNGGSSEVIEIFYVQWFYQVSF
jgi:hypothetical protein